MSKMQEVEPKQINPYLWEVKKEKEMLVPARVYADKGIMQHLLDDIKAGKEWNALTQLINVASLPGIQKYSLAMSDVHPGYGFPIGGVGAFDLKDGVIAVGGVGFDVNCGVRTIKTNLTKKDVEKVKQKLADELFKNIPAGLGKTGDIRLTINEIDEVLLKGAEFSLEQGYGIKEDLNFIEENGKVKGADPEAVSIKAKQRQFKQIGTLGSGNHYLEVQYVDKIYDENAAKQFGLFKDQVLVSIHCGSRALGHQVGTDYLKKLEAASRKYNIKIREKELVCAPIQSPEGKEYFAAVNAAINCAFANRQALAHLTRKSLTNVFKIDEKDVQTFYEIGHNTAKIEKHEIDGKQKEVIVLRKGATRAFGPGRDEVPKEYRKIGQPVLVGGTMGTSSYILHGTEKGMQESFGSAIHGAGRSMSRIQAKRKYRGTEIVSALAKAGIIIKSHSLSGVAEEAPSAYKQVNQVVEVMHASGIAPKVVEVKPLISIKG